MLIWFGTRQRRALAGEFSQLAVSALMEDGEVDFPNAIILHESVVNNQKTKCVYEKLRDMSGTIFKDIIDSQFGSSNENHVQISIGNIPTQLNAGTQAYTYTDYDVDNLALKPGKIKHIRMRPSFVANASTLEIAYTLIHEMIHAELIDRCIKLGIIKQVSILGHVTFTGNPTEFNLPSIIFNHMLTKYNAFAALGGNTQWNHELFNALNYRNSLKQNLLTVHSLLNDTSNDFLSNVNNDLSIVGGPYTLEQLMEYTSWIGLEQTQAYATEIGLGTTAESEKQYVERAANSKYTHNCSN